MTGKPPNWTHIIIHHSLTKDSQTVSWEAIRAYHTDPNGPYKMRDIGYHFGVELVGTEYQIMQGRPLSEPGAHCKELSMNHHGIGICLVGNFDLEFPPEGLLLKAMELIARLSTTFAIPVYNILGHREVGKLAGFDWTKKQYKSCPGAKFDMQALRARISA